MELPAAAPWSAYERVPVDLAAIVSFVAVGVVVFLVSPSDSVVVRAVFGAPLLFFLPGYALLAALFPGASESSSTGFDGAGAGRIASVERIGLSFGTSVAVLPLLLVPLSASRFPLTGRTVFAVLSGAVVAGAAAGWIRRMRLPPGKRFRVSIPRPIASAYGSGRSEPRAETMLNVALIAVVVLSIGTLGYATLAPQHGETYSEFSLLVENESGELTASNYPTELERGADRELLFGVENAERERTTYTVVVALERVEADDRDASVVHESHELGRWQSTLDHGETWHERHAVSPTVTGDDLRLSYYLYVGDAPDDPDPASSYRHVYLWVDVEEPDR